MGADHGERRGQTHVWNGGHRLLITASPPISLSVVIASQFACRGPPLPHFQLALPQGFRNMPDQCWPVRAWHWPTEGHDT